MKKFFFTLLCVLFILISNAQNVGIGTDTPDPSAKLHIQSSNMGILIPQINLNTVSFPSPGPAIGLMVWNTNASFGHGIGFHYNFGTPAAPSWLKIAVTDSLKNVGEMKRIGNVIQNTTDIANDDFVFGSSSLDNISGTNDDNRFFFDKSKGAFRAGNSSVYFWDEDTIGLYSTATGANTIASGDYSVSMGVGNFATGNFSTALGSNTRAYGEFSTAFGIYSFANADNSTAIGNGAYTSGISSVAIGYYASAFGLNSIAIGRNTEATGEQSFSMGNSTDAFGKNSTAMGFLTRAVGENSTVMGNGTLADGINSTAIGNGTRAEGINSIAMGNGNYAGGKNSIAIGNATNAGGKNSIAMGAFTSAPSFCETSIGMFLESYTPSSDSVFVATDRLFVVGNGSGPGLNRSNALTILKNGNTGIGTSSPSETLEVIGNVKASGNIEALGSFEATGDIESAGNIEASANVEAAGYFKAPNWPAFNVYNNLGGDRSVTNGIFNATVESFDNGGNFDLTTDEFTAPVNGFYQFNWTSYTNISSGRVFLYVNGGAVSQTNTNDKSICITLELSAGDKVSIGSAFTMTWYGAVAHNAFSGHLIMAK